MKHYKYSLDKSSRKFVCPRCNKKTLVKYFETETRNYLSDEFGRCDRETQCKYWATPEKENNKVGFNITINDWLEKTEYPNGSDFADVLINELKGKTVLQIRV